MRGIDKNGIASFSEGPVATWEKVTRVGSWLEKAKSRHNSGIARCIYKKARADSSARALKTSGKSVLNRQIHQRLEATHRFLPFQGTVTNVAGA